MPCMGPSMDAAHANADRAFNDIEQLLKTKYYVHITGNILTHEQTIEREKLKSSLKELFWLDAMEW